jgi:hypothetical protein
MRSICLALILWLAGASLAVAQSGNDAIPPARLALAERYIELAFGDEIEAALTRSAELGIAGMPGMDERHARWFRNNLPDRLRALMQALSEAMAPAYARELTHEELEALIAFYDSPLGRSISNKVTRLSVENAAAFQAVVERQSISLMAKFCTEFDCESPTLGDRRSKR